MVQFGFCVMYILHLTLGLGQTLMYPELYFTAHHFILHCILLVGSILFLHWQYSIFICHPDNLIAIFNGCFDPDSKLVRQSINISLADYSYQDLLMIFLPPMLCIVECFIVLLYIFDSSRIHLLHFRFLSQYNKNPVMLIFLLVPDIFEINFLVGTAFLLFTHQVLFFEKCHLTLKTVQEQIR